MGRTVPELLGALTSSELTDWIAYYNIDPFGSEREDYRMGSICATVLNSQRTKGRVFQPSDFIVDFSKPKQKSPEEIKAVLFAFAKQHNANQKE
jgi:hypothetical protein